MALELGKAYVQIVPTAKNLGNDITSMFETAGDQAGTAGGQKAGSAFSGALGKTAGAVGAAVGAAAAGIGAIVSSAVAGFADYEQLVGGVETLFRDSAGAVEGYAAKAYQTAGLSANEYMETVTSFSASLLQSLGGDTEAAAQYADMAVTDMADNANKMGTDMSSIQAAYQGFAKQNYSMLDNLKLGYGGTKEEMDRLIQDAEALDGSFQASRDANGNLTMSYADIVDAIHIVQTEMGITGTTAQEASSTISGSWSSLTSAWQNVLVGMSDGTQDFGGLIDNLAETALTFAGNIMPRIAEALAGAGSLIEGLAPMIAEQLPGLADALLPPLLSAALSLVQSITTALPDLLAVVIAALLAFTPQIVQTGLDLFLALIQAMPQIVTQISAALPQIITGIVTTILSNVPQLVTAGVQLLVALVQNLPMIIAGVVAAIPQIISSLVSAVIGSIPQMASAGYNLLLGLGQGIRNAVSAVWQTMVSAVNSIIDGAKRLLGINSPSTVFAQIGAYTMEGFAAGILRNESLVTDAMEDASELASGSFTAKLVGVAEGGLEGVPGRSARMDDAREAGGKSVNITNNITVNGAESPEAFADRLARRLNMQMRMA